MSLQKRLIATAAAIVLVGAIGLGYAYAEHGKVAIGAAMPDFSLTDYTGKTHKLSELKGQVVVLNFMSKDCPWSRGAAPATASLSDEFAGKGVVFLGVDSNDGSTADSAKQYAAGAKIPYAILLDTKNAYADAVGATRTPEIYVVDKDGKLAYHGAFDDRKEPEKIGAVNYTKQAVDAVLMGKAIEKPEVNAWGCSIKRAKSAGTD